MQQTSEHLSKKKLPPKQEEIPWYIAHFCPIPFLVQNEWSGGGYLFSSFLLQTKWKYWNLLTMFCLLGGCLGTGFCFGWPEHWLKWWHSLDLSLETAENCGRHHVMLEIQEVCRALPTWRQGMIYRGIQWKFKVLALKQEWDS